MIQQITIDPFVVSTTIPAVVIRRGENVVVRVVFSSSNALMSTFSLTDKTVGFYWSPLQYAALNRYWNDNARISIVNATTLDIEFDTATMANDKDDFLCFAKVSATDEVFYRAVFSISLFASPGSSPAVLDIPSSAADVVLLAPTDSTGAYVWDSNTNTWVSIAGYGTAFTSLLPLVHASDASIVIAPLAQSEALITLNKNVVIAMPTPAPYNGRTVKLRFTAPVGNAYDVVFPDSIFKVPTNITMTETITVAAGTISIVEIEYCEGATVPWFVVDYKYSY